MPTENEVNVTPEEVKRRVKEANGEPVKVRNVNTRKVYKIALDGDDATEPYFVHEKAFTVQAEPSKSAPKGRQNTVPTKNYVFV